MLSYSKAKTMMNLGCVLKLKRTWKNGIVEMR